IPPCRKVIRHPVPDMQGFDPVWVREIMNAALEAEGPVLFMCDYGLSRSASLAYGFLRILGARNSEARRCVSIQNFPSTLMLVSVRGAITPMLATDRD
ncbi:MAG: hypothetical protein EBT64_07870, partial [Gammaproteobacteria bacterium]|nr:hypothetical protein [Gammaproteobacteria bacterium]